MHITQNVVTEKHGKIAVVEPLKLLKKIGSTQFIVSARFSENSTETLEQKLLRLIEWEVQNENC
jgi:hypothetical protein